mmetsp:Transcript_15257/g.43030  ORF Transcript_15257/g.43030 Transcript_15257/m.43030 type:complete len:435 (-) Transcript_15257:278-1582(-)
MIQQVLIDRPTEDDAVIDVITVRCVRHAILRCEFGTQELVRWDGILTDQIFGFVGIEFFQVQVQFGHAHVNGLLGGTITQGLRVGGMVILLPKFDDLVVRHFEDFLLFAALVVVDGGVGEELLEEVVVHVLFGVHLVDLGLVVGVTFQKDILPVLRLLQSPTLLTECPAVSGNRHVGLKEGIQHDLHGISQILGRTACHDVLRTIAFGVDIQIGLQGALTDLVPWILQVTKLLGTQLDGLGYDVRCAVRILRDGAEGDTEDAVLQEWRRRPFAAWRFLQHSHDLHAGVLVLVDCRVDVQVLQSCGGYQIKARQRVDGMALASGVAAAPTAVLAAGAVDDHHHDDDDDHEEEEEATADLGTVESALGRAVGRLVVVLGGRVARTQVGTTGGSSLAAAAVGSHHSIAAAQRAASSTARHGRSTACLLASCVDVWDE